MQRVILVGVNLNNDPDFDYKMEELNGLVNACEMEVIGTAVQNLTSLNPVTYIGKGKVQEIKLMAEELDADLIVFDNALKPSQQRNLQREFNIFVMDRTMVILEIFGRRARTKEARLQVESANLQYMLPRLTGLGEEMSRQGGATAGGVANRGAGETQLELDRRKIKKRLSELQRELERIERERRTQRRQREKSALLSVALVGYTNAGKSTLLNLMLDRYMDDKEEPPKENDEKEDSGKKVLEKDMLFATLDTTVRRINPGDNKDFLLSDTVGFIDRLPHTLIKAFCSTLAEACEADLLLEVVDFSDEHYKEQMKVTEETLLDLGAGEIPRIHVMNKADLIMQKSDIPKIIGDKIYMSAKTGEGLAELMGMIQERLFADYVDCEMLIPYSDGGVAAALQEKAVIHSLDYVPEGVKISLLCSASDAGRYGKYILPQK